MGKRARKYYIRETLAREAAESSKRALGPSSSGSSTASAAGVTLQRGKVHFEQDEAVEALLSLGREHKQVQETSVASPAEL